ncbi:hypothetical protein [Brevundimonas sp.]
MTHPFPSQTGLTRRRDARRWSRRFGYGLMIGGSALFWAVAVLAISALI